MKILFLSKQYPLGRDLYRRHYGRFYYLPRELARLQHTVTIGLLSYRYEESIDREVDGIRWMVNSAIPFGPIPYIRKVASYIEESRPDWIIGCSDTYYGILAQLLAARYKTRCVIDAYDNYESFPPRLPPVIWQWRRSLARADLVTVAGQGLVDLIAPLRKDKPTIIVPMAADPEFVPLDRDECRRQLGLPLDRPIVGYTGSLNSVRGPELLFDAIPLIQSKIPSAYFVMSGRRQQNVTLPPAVHHLGYIDDEKMPLLINSLDALVVLRKDCDFGNHGYPVKLYEAIRCRVPVVATNVIGCRWILEKYPECILETNNAECMASHVISALQLGRVHYEGIVNSWSDSTRLFIEGLEKVSGTF